MNDKPAPQHLRNYVQEMVEVGVQLTQMLEHMYRFQATNPDSSGNPPPEVLRDLVAATLQRSFRTSKREVERATNLLRLASTTIAEEFLLVDPEWAESVRNGEAEDDWDDLSDLEFDNGRGSDETLLH